MKRYILSSLLASLLAFCGSAHAANSECHVNNYKLIRLTIIDSVSPDQKQSSHVRILGHELSGREGRSPHASMKFYIPLDKSEYLLECYKPSKPKTFSCTSKWHSK